MFREIGHFLRHAPAALALKSRTSQVELFQALMERADEQGLAEWRAALVRELAGEVLEIGCGTGLMFSHYDASARVTGIDPDQAFLDRARPAAEGATAKVQLCLGSGDQVPAANDTFDTVVVAMVLCSVPDVCAVLREVRRVLRPGGELRLLEHTRSDRPLPAALMSAANPIWRVLNGQGCNMNRDPLPLLRDTGFSLSAVESFQVYSPGLPAFPYKTIRATL